MLRLRSTSELWTLVIHNIPALVLLAVMIILYDLLSRFMFKVPIGLGTTLSIMLFLILVSTAMALLTRVYVRERIITCRSANELVGGVTALLYIAIFSALSAQSTYAVLTAVLMGTALGFGLYMTILVDVVTCMRIPSVLINIIEPPVGFSRSVLVRGRVNVGNGRGIDIELPIKVTGIAFTIINDRGTIVVTGKKLMIEDKGKLKNIESITLNIGESCIIWIGNARIRLTRLS